jgi:hypothetical protein
VDGHGRVEAKEKGTGKNLVATDGHQVDAGKI